METSRTLVVPRCLCESKQQDLGEKAKMKDREPSGPRFVIGTSQLFGSSLHQRAPHQLAYRECEAVQYPTAIVGPLRNAFGRETGQDEVAPECIEPHVLENFDERQTNRPDCMVLEGRTSPVVVLLCPRRGGGIMVQCVFVLVDRSPDSNRGEIHTVRGQVDNTSSLIIMPWPAC